MNRYLMLTLMIGQWLGISQAVATPELEAVNSLAQGCYIIQSPANQRYVNQYHSGGRVNDGENFTINVENRSQASVFHFKPTRFEHYMVSNQNGRYLASKKPAASTAANKPSKSTEWRIEAIAQGSGKFHYRFKSTRLNKTLRYNYRKNKLYFIDIMNPRNRNSETDFILIPQASCLASPEMEVNVLGDRDSLKGNVDDPIRGLVDPHTHITAYEFMGGKFMHGKPFHPFGVTEALNDSKVVHGPNGSLDLIGNLYAKNDINFRYDTRGWPDFPYWPYHRDMSHLGYYYKWIERAHLGGLRMMVTHLVENKVLCDVQSTINPASWINANSCKTMDSIRLQAQRLYEMEDYIDAQAGGPGKGFFRIVTSPQQARQVIADGKLAVLMGIEASETFNCGVNGPCTRHTLEQQLQEVYNLGVRAVFPTHKFDNKLAGSRVEDGFINVGQWLSANYLFDAESCPSDTKGVTLDPEFPILGDIPIIGDIIDRITNPPDYDPNVEYCNQQGISELGVYLVNRLIDMNMLIELDHASERSATHIMDIVEAREYSGVISSHGWLPRSSDGGLHRNLKRLIQAGGFVAPYNKRTDRIIGAIDEYLTEVEASPYLNGVSLATDMSGLGFQAGPRENAQSDPLEYPFTSEFGLVFEQQKSGNRVMDYNSDGLAHFGMLADHLQDIREQASPRIYEAIMNSTEAYVQMWERALDNSNTDYVNPLDLKVRVVNRFTQKCVDVPGEDVNVSEYQQLRQGKCEFKSSDQRWLYDSDSGTLRNSLSESLCLDSREAANRGQLLLRECISDDQSQWTYDGYSLLNKSNNRYGMAAARLGDRLYMYRYRGSKNHHWELRADRDYYVWTTFRTAKGRGCLDVHNADTTNGNYIKLEECHNHPAQVFFYNPKEGTLRSRLNVNKCMTLPNSSTANNTEVVVWDCLGGANQQWDLDGGFFRSRLDNSKVIDIDGSGYGSRVTLKPYSGNSDQKWKAVLQ